MEMRNDEASHSPSLRDFGFVGLSCTVSPPSELVRALESVRGILAELARH